MLLQCTCQFLPIDPLHVGENAANLGGRTIRSQFPEEKISFLRSVKVKNEWRDFDRAIEYNLEHGSSKNVTSSQEHLTAPK